MKESGNVSLIAAAMILMTSVLAAATVDIGTIVLARARAHSAADAAALAGCQELAAGGDPEAAAREYCSANGAAAARISISDDSVTVTALQSYSPLFISRLGINPGPVVGKGKAELKEDGNLVY